MQSARANRNGEYANASPGTALRVASLQQQRRHGWSSTINPAFFTIGGRSLSAAPGMVYSPSTSKPLASQIPQIPQIGFRLPGNAAARLQTAFSKKSPCAHAAEGHVRSLRPAALNRFAPCHCTHCMVPRCMPLARRSADSSARTVSSSRSRKLASSRARRADTWADLTEYLDVAVRTFALT